MWELMEKVVPFGQDWSQNQGNTKTKQGRFSEERKNGQGLEKGSNMKRQKKKLSIVYSVPWEPLWMFVSPEYLGSGALVTNSLKEATFHLS